MITMDNISFFALVLMRMSGCIFFNPIVGRRNLPNIYKVGITVLLSLLVVLSYTEQPVLEFDSTLKFIEKLLLEFLIGFVIGFVVSLFTMVISFGGEVIDLQMGLSMSKIFDPASNINMSLSASFFNIMFTLMFFAMGGHLTLIRLFVETDVIIPFGQVVFPMQNVSMTVLNIFCQCTILAAKMAMPVIAFELLLEAGVGIIMKAIPQINIFVINIQLKVLVGLFILMVMFVPFSYFIENLITLMFDAIKSVVMLFGQ